MKYAKKLPETNTALSEILLNSNWQRLKEPPNSSMAVLFSLPFMIINAIVSILISVYLYPPLKDGFKNAIYLSNSFSFNISIKIPLLFIFIVGLILFTILHEFTHAIFIPNAFKGNKTFWGIRRLYGFVFTYEKIKKGRYLIISIMPFILLSIVLPFILSSIGLLNGYTIFLCLVNAMGSCVDMLTMCLIVFQVPNGSYIINNGSETYFK